MTRPLTTYTVLPFLVALIVGLAPMELPIYRVDAWNVGTARVDAWRGRSTSVPSPAAARTLLDRLVTNQKGEAAVELLTAGFGNRLKALKQEKADLVAEQRKLLATIAAENRDFTDDEKTRDDQISARLKAVNDQIERFERAKDRTPAAIEVGTDRNTLRPWGPTLPAQASAAMQLEARRASLGEFAIAVFNATTGRGSDSRLYAAATGMGTASPSDGAFAIPMEVAAGIEREMFAGGEILSRVDARTITGDSIAFNVIDETSRVAGSRAGGVQGYWVDQGTAPTATQTKLARVEMKLRKVGALGYMTDELVADAAALGGELEALFGDELVFQVEDAIVEGTGAGQPLGYQNATCLVSVAKETGQVAATINPTNLSKMWARLPARSKKTAVWLGNVDVEPQLDLLSIPAGTAALEPRFVTYGPTGILLIKGRPFIPVEYCATLGTVGDLALVDLTRYRLIRKAAGVEQATSIHVRFTQGEQTFRAFYRVDGQPVPRAALTPFKGSNTLSPFVVLATRA